MSHISDKIDDVKKKALSLQDDICVILDEIEKIDTAPVPSDNYNDLKKWACYASEDIEELVGDLSIMRKLALKGNL